MKRLSLARIRVLARINAAEERQAWEDAKWQRLAAFLLDVGGGVVLGVALGLAVVVEALVRLAA